MTGISAAAEQEIKTLLVNWWTAVNNQLAAVTGETVQIGQAPVDMLFASEVGQRLVRIAKVAGAIEAAESRQESYPWAEQLARQILEDCEKVEAWLSQGPILNKTPDSFWSTPVGFMILRAKVWGHQDQLITLSAAAEISGMSLSVLSQRMTRGQIPGYRDPNIKNPKHGRRVRLSELHSLVQENLSHIPLSTTPYLITPSSRIPTPSSS